MKYITTKELRVQTRRILEEARAGAHIAVTFRGKPVALLVPFEETPDLRIREYAEAWPEIETTLAGRRPVFRSPEDALRASRRRR